MDVGDLAGRLPLWLLLVIVAAPGIWAVVVRLLDGQKDRTKERADLIRIAQDAAASVIETLRQRIDDLEAELTELRQEHAQTLAAKDAKIMHLEGELRAAQARAAAFEKLLDANGIPHPPTLETVQPFFHVPQGSGPAPMANP